MAIMAPPAHKQFWMNPRLGLWVDGSQWLFGQIALRP